jgi:hypothetical protein
MGARDGSIMTVSNGNMQFHNFDETSGKWKSFLPYDDFGIIFGKIPDYIPPDDDTGLLDLADWAIITNGRIQFYEGRMLYDTYEKVPHADFILPAGYTKVFRFGFGSIIAVVVNNTVQFYEFKSFKWERNRYYDLEL